MVELTRAVRRSQRDLAISSGVQQKRADLALHREKKRLAAGPRGGGFLGPVRSQSSMVDLHHGKPGDAKAHARTGGSTAELHKSRKEGLTRAASYADMGGSSTGATMAGSK